jgi:predicted nucleic-acid-binding Zn-ribbon protein
MQLVNNRWLLFTCSTCQNQDIVMLDMTRDWKCPHCAYQSMRQGEIQCKADLHS